MLSLGESRPKLRECASRFGDRGLHVRIVTRHQGNRVALGAAGYLGEPQSEEEQQRDFGEVAHGFLDWFVVAQFDHVFGGDRRLAVHRLASWEATQLAPANRKHNGASKYQVLK